MKSAPVTKLKATLSACLAQVKAGEELVVLERGKPIAKLVPIPFPTAEQASLADLARAGLVRLGRGTLPRGFWKRPHPKDPHGRAMAALLDERAEDR